MKTNSLLGLWLAVLLAVATDAGADGTLSFNNNSSQKITNIATRASATGLTVGLYVSTDPYAVLPPIYQGDGSFKLLATTSTMPVPGRFTGPNVTVPGTPDGSYVAVAIRAWPSNFTNVQVAAANWDCDRPPGAAIGASSTFKVGPLSFLNVNSLTGLTSFAVYPNTGIPPSSCSPATLWPATLSVVPGSYPFRFSINADTRLRTSPVVTGFSIQKCTVLTTNKPSMANTNWVTVTNFSPSNLPYYWADPQGTNVRAFYRLSIGYY